MTAAARTRAGSFADAPLGEGEVLLWRQGRAAVRAGAAGAA